MNSLKTKSLASVVIGAAAVAVACGCSTKHTITVEPIYMTLNVNVKLDHELEEAFDYQDRIESEMSTSQPAAETQPAATEPGGAQ